MPKRVLDFDALWSSDKLAACAPWAQAEYAWLYGLADCNGSFELTNLRVIWGRVAAIRHSLTLERLEQIFEEFISHGLLFTWEANGKRYGHWTGSDQPGRLPPPSWRARLERLAPAVPKLELAAFTARFSQSRIPQREFARDTWSASLETAPDARVKDSHSSNHRHQNEGLKPGSRHALEGPQAQDLGLDRGREEDLEWELIAISDSSQAGTPAATTSFSSVSDQKKSSSECAPTKNECHPSQRAPQVWDSAAARKSASPVTSPRSERKSSFFPNRSPLADARVGTGPMVTTGRIRRDVLERMLKRESERRAFPP